MTGNAISGAGEVFASLDKIGLGVRPSARTQISERGNGDRHDEGRAHVSFSAAARNELR